MKKILSFLIAVLLSVNIYAQTSPIISVRIANATTALNQNFSVGNEIYDVATKKIWRVNTALTSSYTITTALAAGYIDLVNGGGTVTSVAALTLGTTGTDLSSTVATGTTTPVITLQVPTASASNRGALSAADWTTFNNKQAAGSYKLSNDSTAGYGFYTNFKALSKKDKSDSIGTDGYVRRDRLTSSLATKLNYRTFGSAANSATTDFIAAVTPSTSGNVLTSDGSAWTSAALPAFNTPNSLTFNNSGSGDASGGTFNGSAAKTISYNSIGALALHGVADNSGQWQGVAGNFTGLQASGLTDGILGEAADGTVYRFNSTAVLSYIGAAPAVSGGYLPLSAGSGQALTGMLYGVVATFSSTVAASQFNASSSISTPVITITTGAVDGYFLKTNGSGVATWAAVATSQVYKGTWNANTNTPTLANGTGTAGWFYRCTTAGTTNFGAGGIAFNVGDDASYNGTIWERIPAAVITGNALTKTDDTNVTLTLGGSASTSLLNAASITVGWTGTLANARLTNSSLTIGSTNIALGATATTIAGLTSVTSTGFTGALTGTSTGLAAAYIDWNATSGGTFIQNKPTLYNDHLKTQKFAEAASGSTGQVNTLSNTPKDATGVRVSLNGSTLDPANYTVSGATVQVTLPVYAYDVVTISFLY